MNPDPISLSLTQTFDMERFHRDIDSCTNLEELKELTKKLYTAWVTQKAACLWVMRQNHERLPSKDLLEDYQNSQA